MPTVVQAAVGRFPRNPALFYEMRIARESKEIATHPQKLDLYDDLAVASDRIGKDDVALKWIEAKRTRMGDLSKARTTNGKRDPLSEAAYRYFANAGTIRLVRWMRHGGKVAEIAELEKSRELIQSAIEINPNAHFGREVVQLKFIDWLIDNAGKTDASSFSKYLATFGGDPTDDPSIDQSLRQEDVKGLVGLVALGAGWESPDIFEALSHRIPDSRDHNGKLGFFVRQHQMELLSTGRKALAAYEDGWRDRSTNYDEGWIKDEYRRLRQEADQWQSARTSYIMPLLKTGRHPDTDPHFWDGYHSDPAPDVNWALRDLSENVKANLVFGSICFLFVLAAVGFVVWRFRRSCTKKSCADALHDGLRNAWKSRLRRSKRAS